MFYTFAPRSTGQYITVESKTEEEARSTAMTDLNGPQSEDNIKAGLKYGAGLQLIETTDKYPDHLYPKKKA